MSKYEPLKAFLAASAAVEVPMQFAEIERVIGAELPAAAFRHRAWWSNNPTNSVITHAWLEAGYKTAQVDMNAHRLVFRRVTGPILAAAGGRLTTAHQRRVVDALRKALAGTVRLAEGVDLTAPTGETWDAERP